jgi:hypothetical protein
MASNLSPELANRLAQYFAQPESSSAYTDPSTKQSFLRAENPLLQGYSFMQHLPGGAGTLDPQYDANGNFVANRPRPTEGFMDKMISSSLPAFAMLAAPFILPALGFGAAGAGAAGAGAGATAAGAADLTMGGLGGATAFTPATAAEMAGMGLGGASEFAIPAGVAFNRATAAEMASMGLGDAAAATATMGAGAAPATFNAAADSQLANAAIEQAGGSALNTTIPSVTVNGAPTGSFLSSIGSAASNLFSGNSGTNTIGDGGGFDWTKLIGPALNAAGGVMGANAASSAADAQLQAAREAAALNEPFRQAGMQGMNRLTDLLGVSGRTGAEGYGSAAKQFGMADFQADPGAEFRRQQGEQGLQRAASASGGLGSGKYLKDAMTFNSGLASQEYNQAFNRFQTNRASVLNPLQSLMGAGQTAANTIGEYGTQGANAQAAGKVGQANAYTNAITQGMSAYQNGQQMDQNRLFQNALMNRWTNGG